MEKRINPLADIASILGSIAQALPPLPPPPPFPVSPSPEVPKPLPSSPSVNYAVAEDGLLKAAMEEFRAEQRKKGLVPFVYE